MFGDHLLNIVKEFKNLKHLYRNKLDKACFAHHAAYSNCKDLGKRTISDQILRERDYEIARNCNYDGYNRALVSMDVCFLIKSRIRISVNEQLAEELRETIIKTFNSRKVSSRFKDDIWAGDLAEIGSLSSKNKNVKYLLCVIDIFIECALVKPLKK